MYAIRSYYVQAREDVFLFRLQEPGVQPERIEQPRMLAMQGRQGRPAGGVDGRHYPARHPGTAAARQHRRQIGGRVARMRGCDLAWSSSGVATGGGHTHAKSYNFV